MARHNHGIGLCSVNIGCFSLGLSSGFAKVQMAPREIVFTNWKGSEKTRLQKCRFVFTEGFHFVMSRCPLLLLCLVCHLDFVMMNIWSKAIEQWMNKPDLVCFYRAGSSCSVIFLPVLRPLLGCERLLSGFFSQCFLCACCGYRVTELSLFSSPMAYRCFVQIIFVGKFQSFLRPCKTTFKFFPALF